MILNRMGFPVFMDDYDGEPEPKKGGSKSPGKRGGIYTYQGQKLMLKRETFWGIPQPQKVIAEFVAGAMLNAMVKDAAPKMFFVRDDADLGLAPDECGDNVYLASVFHPEGSRSFYNIAFDRHDSTRRIGMETFNPTKRQFREAIFRKNADGNFYKCKFHNYLQVLVGSLKVGDFDFTSTNIYEYDEETKRVDLGEALTRLNDEVHMHSHRRHLGLFDPKRRLEPTNHFREIPRYVKISPEFANAIDELTDPDKQLEVQAAIGKALSVVKQTYGLEPIQKFAKHIGMHHVDEIEDKDELINKVKGYLIAKDESRARSLKQLAMEIRMSLCFKRDPDSRLPKFECDKQALAKLVVQDPVYFIKGDYHFRSKDQRWNFGLIKYRYRSLSRQTRDFVAENVKHLVALAKKEGKPEIIEALSLSKKHGGAFKQEDYQAVLLKYYQGLLKELEYEGMKALKGRMIEEILREKSLPHRAKIIDRLIYIYQNCDNEKIKKTIRNTLANPSIRRLQRTHLESGKLEQFYEAATADALKLQPKDVPVVVKRGADDELLQEKWNILSESCEKTIKAKVDIAGEPPLAKDEIPKPVVR